MAVRAKRYQKQQHPKGETEMRKLTSMIMALLLICAPMMPTVAVAQELTNYRIGGEYVAFAYGQYTLKSLSTVAATSATMNVSQSGQSDINASCFVNTAGFGGKRFTPLFVGDQLTVLDSNSETVTVTAASSTAGACSFTATFASAHNPGASVVSGTLGLAEAVQDAFSGGGGVVQIGPEWPGTNAMIALVNPFHSVSIKDNRNAGPLYWNIGQAASTALATPATLTAVTALPSATPVGAYGTGTYHMCVSYVDIMGNEGTCSADFSEAGLATGSFIFSAPAASTGAVGYTIYISLTSGTYALSYKVPLTSSICALTAIETVTTACKVTNALYGQTGAAATVTAITVNTARLAPNATTISTTADYVPNPNARTVYAYIPSNHVALPGIVSASLAFPVGAAAGTTVPDVVGTLTIPAGFMNFVGREIEICGFATEASAGSTATISNFQLWWDADGSNAAGVPVLIGTIPMTNTLVTAKSDQFQFCYDLKTTVAGAGVTAGSILQNGGYYQNQYTSSSVATVPVTVLGQAAAAVGSLNLAGEARIEVVWLHTTGTDANGVVLQDLTVKVLN